MERSELIIPENTDLNELVNNKETKEGEKSCIDSVLNNILQRELVNVNELFEDTRVSIYENKYSDQLIYNSEGYELNNLLTNKFSISLSNFDMKKCESSYEKAKTIAMHDWFTPGGYFDGTACIENLKWYSKLMCIDIYEEHNIHIANFNQLREELLKIENIAYIGKPYDKNGFYVFIPIADGNKHEEYFDAIERAMWRLNIFISEEGKDITRRIPCYYDTDFYKADFAIIFDTYLNNYPFNKYHV